MHVAARFAAVVVAGALVATACGSDDDALSAPAVAAPTVTSAPAPTPSAVPPTSEPTVPASNTGELFPDVVDAKATFGDDGTWTFDVTMTSPYDTADRYADGWRIKDSDGSELGVRVLTHGHAGEQPFTRSLSGVEIPVSVDSVIIEGRDQINGWGGATVEVALER